MMMEDRTEDVVLLLEHSAHQLSMMEEDLKGIAKPQALPVHPGHSTIQFKVPNVQPWSPLLLEIRLGQTLLIHPTRWVVHRHLIHHNPVSFLIHIYTGTLI